MEEELNEMGLHEGLKIGLHSHQRACTFPFLFFCVHWLNKTTHKNANLSRLHFANVSALSSRRNI